MIIGISAKAQSGKTTLALMLEELTGYKQYALAKPIKDIMCLLFGWDERHREGELKEVDCDFVITWIKICDAKKMWDFYGFDKIKGNFIDELPNILGSLDIDYLVDLTDRYDPESLVIKGCTSPRNVFQKFGTEYGREQVDQDIWLSLAPDNCILSDVRFENESAHVRQHGCLIFLKREETNEIFNSGHISENGVKQLDSDYVIINNSTLENLQAEAQKFYNSNFQN